RQSARQEDKDDRLGLGPRSIGLRTKGTQFVQMTHAETQQSDRARLDGGPATHQRVFRSAEAATGGNAAGFHGHSHIRDAFSSTKSSAQHPKTCGPGLRKCTNNSAAVHPASSSASARIPSRSNARSM